MDKHLEEEALAKTLQGLPMSEEMPSNVRAKALNIAVEANRKAQAARRPRTVAWLTAGIAVVAAAAFMMPRPAAAKTWTLVAQAVQKITSVQMDMKVSDTKGENHKVSFAVQGGKMLIDSGEGPVIYMDREAMQVYDPKENTVTKMIMPAMAGQFLPDIAGEMVKSFDLKKEIGEMEKKYGKDHIRVMPIRQGDDGRDVYDVQMTQPDGPAQCFMTVDAASDLPIYIDVKDVKDGKGEGVESMVLNLRYNDRVQIEPNFPANAKVTTMDLGDMEAQGKAFEKAFEKMEAFGKAK